MLGCPAAFLPAPPQCASSQLAPWPKSTCRGTPGEVDGALHRAADHGDRLLQALARGPPGTRVDLEEHLRLERRRLETALEVDHGLLDDVRGRTPAPAC